jgi:CysZ protein
MNPQASHYQQPHLPIQPTQQPDFFNDITDGIFSYGKAVAFLSKHRLWHYAWLPGIVSLILGGSIAYAAYILSYDVQILLTSLYPETWWGFNLITQVAAVFSWLILAITGILGYRVILMALVAPFMSPLASKVQAEILGTPVFDPPFFSFTNLRLILRGMILSLRNVFKELWYVLWLLLLGLVPVVGFAVPFLIFFVQSFYAGFGNLDYSLEKYYGIAESKKFSRRYRWLAVGNGMVFMGLLAVPVLGLFLAPALSVTAATLESTKRIDAPLKNVQALEQFI